MPHSDPHSFRVLTRYDAALWMLGLVLVIVAGWALRAMAPVAVPLVFAVLITLLVAPLDHQLRRALPDALGWLAHVAVMLVILGVLMIFGGALVFAAQQALDAMPDVTDQIDSVFPSESQKTSGEDVALTQELRRVWGNAGGMFGNWVVDQATTLAQSALGVTGAFFSAMVFVFFMVLLGLTELTQWRGKLCALMDGGNQKTLHYTLLSLTRRLRRFLAVRTLVGMLQAALYVGWLAIFGIDLLLVWAVVTFVLTYIPSVGSFISGALPVLYAFVVSDPTTALMVAAGIFVIEQVVGNYLDPQLQGQQIALSPMVILVTLMVWGWIWGVAGAFLATPITLCMLVVMHRITPLRPLALFLSNQASLEGLDNALNTGSRHSP